jgi:hypothetical protein
MNDYALNQRFVADIESGSLENDRDAIGITAQETRKRKTQITSLVERLATLLVNRVASRSESSVRWAVVKPFGSSAIGADLACSDLDLYVQSASPPKRYRSDTTWLVGESGLAATLDGRVQPPHALLDRNACCVAVTMHNLAPLRAR